MAKATQLGTLAGMTGLIGILPMLLTLVAALAFPTLGAAGLAIIHVLLMGAGLCAFIGWFGD